MNDTWILHTNTRTLVVAAVCLGFAGLAGCAEKGRATVSGKVTFNNQPLTAGTISFMAGSNRVGSGVIHPDGTYSVGDAPIGDVTVTIETPEARGPAMMRGQEAPPPGVQGMPADMKPPGADQSGMAVKIVPAPTKYAKVETSPLHYTITEGTQTIDISLTP